MIAELGGHAVAETAANNQTGFYENFDQLLSITRLKKLIWLIPNAGTIGLVFSYGFYFHKIEKIKSK